MLIEGITLSDAFLNFPVSAESLFCDLSPKAARELARIKKISLFEKGVLLLSKDRIPTRLCMLLQGEAEIIADKNSNSRKFIRRVVKNEMLGLTEMLAGKPYKFRLETKTPCLCECIECCDFIRLIQTETEISYRLVELLGSGFQKSFRAFTLQ